MEDIPAGKLTKSFIELPTPKKSNPIGIESQWSFGWQGGEKNIFNKSNSSKSNTYPYFKVLPAITTKVVSFLEIPRDHGRIRMLRLI